MHFSVVLGANVATKPSKRHDTIIYTQKNTSKFASLICAEFSLKIAFMETIIKEYIIAKYGWEILLGDKIFCFMYLEMAKQGLFVLPHDLLPQPQLQNNYINKIIMHGARSEALEGE